MTDLYTDGSPSQAEVEQNPFKSETASGRCTPEAQVNMPHGVMVAQLVLIQPVQVQILVG